jgi:tRNA threonylcarbamoyladenosine biosynthesis protein TsaE
LPNPVNNIAELIHTDCYRLATPEDACSIGLDEYFERDDIITLIEWPEKIASIIPSHARAINFEHVDENSRKISYEF